MNAREMPYVGHQRLELRRSRRPCRRCRGRGGGGRRRCRRPPAAVAAARRRSARPARARAERASTLRILVRVALMTDVLIYADTFRSPELRHEVPLGIPDPFLYVERNGARHIVIGSMEIPRLRGAGTVRAAPGRGVRLRRADRRGPLLRRDAAESGAPCGSDARHDEGRGPGDVPALARRPAPGAGVELAADGDFFDERRRVKTERQLAGIRRAQRAAEAGMDAARDLLRRASANGDGLRSTAPARPSSA